MAPRKSSGTVYRSRIAGCSFLVRSCGTLYVRNALSIELSLRLRMMGTKVELPSGHVDVRFQFPFQSNSPLIWRLTMDNTRSHNFMVILVSKRCVIFPRHF